MDFTPEFPNLNRYSGWAIFSLILIGYVILYIINIFLPLDFSFPFEYQNLTSRIWSWTELLLGVGAIMNLFINRAGFSTSGLIRGIILGIISGASHYGMNQSLTDGILTGLLVLVCYVSALTIFRTGHGVPVISFQESPVYILRLILFGIIISVPFACINLGYFYLNQGLLLSPGIIDAIFLACNPAISEEIIFRFFPVILTFALLRNESSDRRTLCAVIFIGVVPHSLNHLPELFVTNPIGAVIMCILTSLLFGLLMCLLQLYKGLPSACGFHWFVDMTRFLAGY
jgi:hypothetical protein